jgi:hypothetical protein
MTVGSKDQSNKRDITYLVSGNTCCILRETNVCCGPVKGLLPCFLSPIGNASSHSSLSPRGTEHDIVRQCYTNVDTPHLYVRTI